MEQKTVYVGVNDHEIDLFEGIYNVPNGMAYNSYVLIDEKTAVLDTVDRRFTAQWLANVERALNGKTPDYLVVLHMEPDHSASIDEFVKKYPEAKLVGNAKTFIMLGEYFSALKPEAIQSRCLTVKEGDVLDLGGRKLTFIFAPMVHWPEVMMAYDDSDKSLFSADAFGKFGALDVSEPWDDEARRYYIGIVGKYGVQVAGVLKKAAALDIKRIRSLHGPVLEGEQLVHALELYNKWASYIPEHDGVCIAYTSVYGHTAAAARELALLLESRGKRVAIYDLAREDRAKCVAEAFAYPALVLATTTYNADIFPAMREFIDCLTERNFQNRVVALIENGSWAPLAAKAMQAKLEKCKNVNYACEPIKLMASLSEENHQAIKALASTL